MISSETSGCSTICNENNHTGIPFQHFLHSTTSFCFFLGGVGKRWSWYLLAITPAAWSWQFLQDWMGTTTTTLQSFTQQPCSSCGNGPTTRGWIGGGAISSTSPIQETRALKKKIGPQTKRKGKANLCCVFQPFEGQMMFFAFSDSKSDFWFSTVKLFMRKAERAQMLMKGQVHAQQKTNLVETCPRTKILSLGTGFQRHSAFALMLGEMIQSDLNLPTRVETTS